MFSSTLKRGGWLCLLALPYLTQAQEQQASDLTIPSYQCSDEKAAECHAEFRICYQEECTDCATGYVEIPEEVKEITPDVSDEEALATLFMNSNSTYCVEIETLSLAVYERFFRPTYSDDYDDLDAEDRLNILLGMAKVVSDHNSQIPKPSFKMSLNSYSADTARESQRLGGYVVPEDGTMFLAYVIAQTLEEADSDMVVPTRTDWVERGAVTSVKDQGRCGCCWAISVAGAIEGAAAITSNFEYLQSVSFQQLVSCDTANGGCGGGFPAAALNYANNNKAGGTATLNNWPFTDSGGTATETCNKQDQRVAVDSQLGRAIVYYGATGGDSFEERMTKMKAGVARQPVAIAVNTKCNTFKGYSSGVITDDEECSCGPMDIEGCLDHAVLLVGYDDAPENGDPAYWKIKNSWGKDWGEDGYIRIAQLNPHEDDPNQSWGLFGVLAEGVVPLQAFNLTYQVYDEPQELGMETWEIVVICLAALVGAILLGILLAWLYNKFCKSAD